MTIQANFPAIKPSLLLDFASTKQLDPRITYTRASTATFYNGVTTAKAEQNLATYSQQFDNAAWLKENSSITADSTTAPDGTTTADSLVESSANGPHGTYTALLSVTTASTVTVSIYAKQNTKRYIVLGSTDGFANYPVLFDLQSGVVVGNATGYPAYSAPTSSSITSVGSSWYRLTVTLAINGAASSARVIAYLTDDSGSVSTGFSYTGNGTSSAYIWGAQLEQRSAVTAYTATTTQAITNYIPVLQTAASGVARFDNNPTTGESLGLLIEESRTNLFTYSSDFSNAIWTKSAISITSAANVAPDGTLTAQKLVEDTATSGHSISELITPATATAYTATVYVKPAGRNYICLYANNPGAGKFFDLVNGTVLGNFSSAPTSASITSVGNGWYRCSITVTTTSTSPTGANVYISSDGTSLSYTGNGFSGMFMWGAQLEAGSFATSYIPTVASQVTRAADAASMTGTNFTTWYNTGSGSYYVEAATQLTAGTLETFIQDQSISIGVQGSGGNLRVSSTPAQGNLINTLGTAAYPSTSKIGVSYQQGTSASLASGNGSTAGTFTYPQSFATSFGIGTAISGGGYGAKTITGYIKKVAYYPVALTATNLQALTS